MAVFDKLKKTIKPEPAVAEMPPMEEPAQEMPDPVMETLQQSKKGKRGQLPIEVVAAVQVIYQQEQRQGGMPGNSDGQQIQLNPGWGGKGR